MNDIYTLMNKTFQLLVWRHIRYEFNHFGTKLIKKIVNHDSANSHMLCVSIYLLNMSLPKP